MVRFTVKALCLSAIALVSAKSPLLAWTNKNVANVASTNFATVDNVSSLLAPFLDTCPESVLILDQPEFNIATLKDMNVVKDAFNTAKSAIQVGHFDAENVNNVDAIVNAIAEKCNNAIVSEDKLAEKNSLVISKLSQNINEAQRIVKKLLSKINDNTLVVYLSNNNVKSNKLLVQRQDAAPNATPEATPNATTDTTPNATQDPNATQNPNNNNAGGNADQNKVTPVKETATFGKYVFLNNAVFEGMVIMVPVLLIITIGVSWLISIQTPTRFPKKKDN
ncbi:hypothetical protein H8356DRAFT_924033 [Neocallimastix lanati (nom. inval.)]|jgi:hypothetical protein|uniref:V-type proton ATPase subunit S1/VOA1 transmembrane domain-containing protein n=1 Tax=Neocallimastix californiae TaxID=1754190 RepID=A0A1Y2FPC8_9FUNG|nr:hypothetical protein H8356DRAFT_924033 [Neocallimastix sp. JGI-2020a]ORY85841.1 hypothetical protein LY90DRAFT_663323 [Neocallimastix californiae]|eukprot:ORY85841.1 hypothetical protein LY90DRAFT_663323 [Neocallimastix californiae]